MKKKRSDTDFAPFPRYFSNLKAPQGIFSIYATKQTNKQTNKRGAKINKHNATNLYAQPDTPVWRHSALWLHSWQILEIQSCNTSGGTVEMEKGAFRYRSWFKVGPKFASVVITWCWGASVTSPSPKLPGHRSTSSLPTKLKMASKLWNDMLNLLT